MGANLNISIGATLEPLKRSITGVMSMMSQFASNLGTQGAAMKAQIDKAAADINKELESATQGFSNFNKQAGKTDSVGKSFVSMRTQMRQAVQEAYKLSQEFGINSQQALKAQQHAAALKEEMSDMSARINAMNPEAKFKAMGDAIKGGVGVIQGAAGAMAAFGGESEQTQEVIKRLQGLMALTSGIDAIVGMKDSFSTLKAVIMTNVAALNTMKGALIATGIGALAVGLGLLIANFDTVTNSIYKFFTGEETAAVKTEKLKAATEAYKKELEDVGKQLENQNKINANYNSTIVDERKKAYAELERQRNFDTNQELLKAKKGEQTYKDAAEISKSINAKYLADKRKLDEQYNKENTEKFTKSQEEKLAALKQFRDLSIAAIQDENKKRLAEINESKDTELKVFKDYYTKGIITYEQYKQAEYNIAVKYSKQISEVSKNQLTQLNSGYDELKTKLNGVAVASKNAMEPLGIGTKRVIPSIQELNKQMGISQKISVDFGAEVKNLAVDSFVALGEAIGEVASGQNGLEGFFVKMGSIISSFLIQIGKSLITTAIASKAFKVAFANPAVALAAGVAAVAAGTILKNQLQKGPAFANGGIVYGPTVGLMGEYSGAKSNPEVIAPLDKLKSMISGGNMNVQGLLYGNDLAIVNSRTMSFTNRRR